MPIAYQRPARCKGCGKTYMMTVGDVLPVPEREKYCPACRSRMLKDDYDAVKGLLGHIVDRLKKRKG